MSIRRKYEKYTIFADDFYMLSEPFYSKNSCFYDILFIDYNSREKKEWSRFLQKNN